MKASKNQDAFFKFENAMQQAPWIAKNFSRTAGRCSTRRPTRSSSTRARATVPGACFYNKPENALKMTIKGPAGDEQAYVDAFNEVFGA